MVIIQPKMSFPDYALISDSVAMPLTQSPSFGSDIKIENYGDGNEINFHSDPSADSTDSADQSAFKKRRKNPFSVLSILN